VNNVLTINLREYEVTIPQLYARKSTKLFQEYFPIIQKIMNSFQENKNYKIMISIVSDISRSGGLGRFAGLLEGVRISNTEINNKNYDMIFAGRLDLLAMIVYEAIKYNWSIIFERLEDILILCGYLENQDIKTEQAIATIINPNFLIYPLIANGCARLWEMDSYYSLSDALDVSLSLYAKQSGESSMTQSRLLQMVG